MRRNPLNRLNNPLISAEAVIQVFTAKHAKFAKT
jgi:hypothetical protein